MPDPLALEVHDLVVQFGGLTAVDGVSLEANPGCITGLIGPNGAGKTTTFDACSGLIAPTGGHILLGGQNVTSEPPERRARRGLGRTFQRMELYDSLSVRENVELGLEARLAGDRVWRHLTCIAKERVQIDGAASEAMELCDIAHLADHAVARLATGQRRLTELARVIAGNFSCLLLDEPSSGLDPAETRAFGDTLKRLVGTRGVGILLVEHDMSLVMSCCELIFVIDFGKLIFDGTPTETQASAVVRNAYLGADV